MDRVLTTIALMQRADINGVSVGPGQMDLVLHVGLGQQADVVLEHWLGVSLARVQVEGRARVVLHDVVRDEPQEPEGGESLRQDSQGHRSHISESRNLSAQ
jgi:hypothetical protein